MRSMQLVSPRPAESLPLEEVIGPVPSPSPGEILLEVSGCGVCRTDLQLCEGDLASHRLPIIPGHQIVGRVIAIADGAGSWRVGDRAGVAWLAGACGTCDRCREGRENLCRTATFTGWDRDGGYATHALVRADFALRDAAVTFAPKGSVVIAALKALDRGGTVAINAIHLDQVPSFSYDDLWWERNLRSVANFTRQDALELLELAETIPIKTSYDVYPLCDANRALQDVKAGRVGGAAVLKIA